MRSDWYTDTEHDAGRYERWRSIDDYDDTPSASDLAADAELDAFEARLRKRERDAAGGAA